MLEGKRFFPETGMPILKIARRMVLLAVELPEPFLVPTMIEKSFMTLSIVLLKIFLSLRGAFGATKQSHPTCKCKIASPTHRLRLGLAMTSVVITVCDTKG